MRQKWANKVFIFSLLLILVVTLFPYDFAFKENASKINYRFLTSEFFKLRNFYDLITNVLLFSPFGFVFSCLMQQKRFLGRKTLVFILLTSFCLSFTIEILQLFIPSRSSSFVDIGASILGAFIGFLSFRLGGDKILGAALNLLRSSNSFLSIKKLTTAFIGYIILIFLATLLWQSSGSLSNWNHTFPLSLGNEPTGNRPWKGYISELYVANKAVSDQEAESAFSSEILFSAIKKDLVAVYQLTGTGSYPDLTGHLPDLSWRENSPTTQDQRGASLDSNHWLETKSSVALMTQKIAETSQFTIGAVVATADTMQAGPARIISLSADDENRNFTLGQKGADLVFRVRTPVTGKNATNYQLAVPNVFGDTKNHQILLTYEGSILKIYIDGLKQPYSLKLVPEVMIFQLLPFDANSINLEIYKIFYYGLIFIPIGFFLALISARARGKLIFYAVLLFGGILFPSLILEVILAIGTQRAIRLDNLLFSMALAVSTMLIVKRWANSWLRREITA
ncbi:VanZ family protein [Trichocoleus sp. ST-U3]|uniref:VanZ family protein n=1 Tax=Coleofasciculus sp. FACHB-542 TaxID=2692787 RepID=UPI001685B81B|nr:VanZ family protein [Coleofasciculus sp. FACHB-542]MBD2086060.1 VanZ family protein [Coleofasciculus sp. FACHB-542]